MPPKQPVNNYERILVIMPNWVGDVVLATPFLQKLRAEVPRAQITALLRPYVQDVLSSCPWIDAVQLWPETPGKRRAGFLHLAAQLKNHDYDLAILLPNSFRSALLAWWVGIPQRIGYARDYRSWLLTDRIKVPVTSGKYAVESMLSYYGRILQHLGLSFPDDQPQLFIDPESEAAVAQWWSQLKLRPDQPMVLLNPGSSFGPSKLYPPDRFARVADLLADRKKAQILINAGPGELAIAEKVRSAMLHPAIILSPPRMNLRDLKAVINRCDLVITNDTGPRHFAIALKRPVITIFGSTHPGWTETNYDLERKIQIAVDCGPCQKPVCPLDHRCMTGISPDLITGAAEELLERWSNLHVE